MYISKVTFFCEMFVLRQIRLSSVFHDANAIFLQQIMLKDQADNFPVKAHVVRWIGKNKIILFVAFPKEITHIRLDDLHLSFKPVFFDHILNEAHAIVIGIDTGHMTSLPGSELERNIARSGAKVQDFKVQQAELVLKDIEQSFLRKIRCRAGRKVFGH